MATFCKNCGTQLNGNMTFCPNCGTPILQNDFLSVNNSLPKKKNNKKNIFIIAAVIVTVIIGLIILGVVLSEKNESSGGSRKSKETENDYSYMESDNDIVSNWKINYYTDEFGDYTSDACVVGNFYGTFSNSATTSSELSVVVFMDKSTEGFVTMKLLEYNRSLATFLQSDKITLKIKNESDQIISYPLIYSDGLVGCVDNNLVNEILYNKNLSCVITAESKYYSVPPTYHFNITNVGLSELYDKT